MDETDVEIDSGCHRDTPGDDERRAVGLGLPRLSYERPVLLRPNFIPRLLADLQRMSMGSSAAMVREDVPRRRV